MDMKHILQAFDSAVSKPVGNSTDMKRFLSIVTEAVDTSKKYQRPVTNDTISSKPEPVISRYFKLAEAEIEKRSTDKQQLINQRARHIVERMGLTPSSNEDPIDTVTMDIPLFIRLLEYAREDAKTDMDLHDLTENAIKLSKEIDSLSMDNYAQLIGKE